MRVLASLLLVAAFLVAGGPTHAQSLPEIRIAALPIDVSAEPFYAADLGYFKDAGLDAHVTIQRNGAAVAAALAGGSIDVGVTNIIAVGHAYERGLTFKIVAPGALFEQSAPTTVCAVAKDSSLTDAKSAIGKTFGVPDLGGLPKIAISQWMQANGADPNSIKLVEVPFASMVPALQSNRIDVGILVNPLLQHAVDAGEVRVLSNCLAAVAPQFAIAEFYATSDYAAAHADVLKRFETAIERAGAWANAHHAESAQILERWTKAKIAPNAARAHYAEKLDASDYQPEIDEAARWKVFKAAFPVTNLFVK